MTENTPVHVIVTVLPKEGELQAVIAGFETSQKRLKADPDCLDFEIYEHVGTPPKLILLEVWTSALAHQQEVAGIMASAAFPMFRDKLKDDLHFQYLSPREGGG